MLDKKLLNLGCGPRYHKEWVNVDFYSDMPDVIAHNLLKGIPFAENEFDAVYHSNVLEHFPRDQAESFLRECFRVLKPGGILRTVVPDLEDIAKCYLEQLKIAAEGDSMAGCNYDWILLEIYDQTVRNYSGGEMAKYLRQNEVKNEDFVFKRCGTVVKDIRASFLENLGSKHKNQSKKYARLSLHDRIKPWAKASRLHDMAKRLVLGKEYSYLEIGRFRMSGEIHQWMYDRYSLTRLLNRCGFEEVKIKTAFESGIANWNEYGLDVKDGVVHAPSAIFVEGTKPKLVSNNEH